MEEIIAVFSGTFPFITELLFWVVAPVTVGGLILYYADPEGDWHEAVDMFLQDTLPLTFQLIHHGQDGDGDGGGGSTGVAAPIPPSYIRDDNGNVSAILAGETLTGGTKEYNIETHTYSSCFKDGSTRYYLEGTTLRVEKGSDTLEITNFCKAA